MAVGSYIGINHPKDNIMVNKGKVPLNSTCNKYHYVFTDSMKEAIEGISTAIDNY